MNKKTIIAPSLLSGDFGNMAESINNIKLWGADWAHCDVMDGVFVPNITFGMPMIKAFKKYSNLVLDVHLMIINPEKYIQQFIDAGADIITFHPNSTDNVDECINIVKKANKKVGLVLNPDISFDLVIPYLHKIDMVVMMGVFAGFGGQKFIANTLNRLRELKVILKEKNLNIDIQVDGGVVEENCKEIVNAGANVLVGGSCVFNSKNPTETIRILKS